MRTNSRVANALIKTLSRENERFASSGFKTVKKIHSKESCQFH